MKNGVENIQTAGYNGACTVYIQEKKNPYNYCVMVAVHVNSVRQEFIRKGWRKELLYCVNLIRACKKVLNQLAYIGKKVCIP